MSKLAKAVVGTVLKLNCPECAEAFDLYWDIAEDIVDAATGEVMPWICAKCRNKKKSKHKYYAEGDREASDQGINVSDPSLGGDNYSQSEEQYNRYVTDLKQFFNDQANKMAEVISNSEDIKKDISNIKTNILDIKQELMELRFLISNRSDG